MSIEKTMASVHAAYMQLLNMGHNCVAYKCLPQRERVIAASQGIRRCVQRDIIILCCCIAHAMLPLSRCGQHICCWCVQHTVLQSGCSVAGCVQHTMLLYYKGVCSILLC